MQRSAILMILILLFIGSITFLFIKFQRKESDLKIIEERIQRLPEIHFQTLQDDVIELRNFANGKPLLLMYINTECGACQIELESLYKRRENFREFQVLLVSSQETKEITDALCDFPFLTLSNFQIGRDEDLVLSTHLGVSGYPSIFCYNKEGDLLANFRGTIKLDVILDLLQGE